MHHTLLLIVAGLLTVMISAKELVKDSTVPPPRSTTDSTSTTIPPSNVTNPPANNTKIVNKRIVTEKADIALGKKDGFGWPVPKPEPECQWVPIPAAKTLYSHFPENACEKCKKTPEIWPCNDSVCKCKSDPHEFRPYSCTIHPKSTDLAVNCSACEYGHKKLYPCASGEECTCKANVHGAATERQQSCFFPGCGC
jgi:hypothetical protein